MQDSPDSTQLSHYETIKRMSDEVPEMAGWDLFYNNEIDKESKKKLKAEGFEVIKLKQKSGISYKIKLPRGGARPNS